LSNIFIFILLAAIVATLRELFKEVKQQQQYGSSYNRNNNNYNKSVLHELKAEEK